MGGSSSKKVKEEANKKNTKLKDDQNETYYREQKQKEIHNKIINNDKNLIIFDDVSNDIEEFTLDKNGLLINEKEKDIIKPKIEPRVESKLEPIKKKEPNVEPKIEVETEEKPDNHIGEKPVSKISLINYNDIIKEKE